MHIFFTDLDGTLLNDKKQITPRTMEAIAAYIAAGNKFVISSGRPLSSIFDVMKNTGLDRYQDLLLISYNGSLVYDCKEKKALMDFPMDIEDIMHIIHTAEEIGIHCQTYTATHAVCKRHDKEVDFYIHMTGMDFLYDETITGSLTEPPYKALAISLDDKNRLNALRDKLLPWMAGKYATVFSCNELIEFVDYRSGKGNAVKNVCDLFHISVSEAYAAGDANNDVSMLEAAGNSIAMLNGSDEVKSVSSIITEYDNNHDGLADILLKLSR